MIVHGCNPSTIVNLALIPPTRPVKVEASDLAVHILSLHKDVNQRMDTNYASHKSKVELHHRIVVLQPSGLVMVWLRLPLLFKNLQHQMYGHSLFDEA